MASQCRQEWFTYASGKCQSGVKMASYNVKIVQLRQKRVRMRQESVRMASGWGQDGVWEAS